MKNNISYNRKTGVIHIQYDYKNRNYIEQLFSLLKITFLTVVNYNFGKYEKISKIEANSLIETIEKMKDDRKVVSLLFLDGDVSILKENCESIYLLEGAIRFFVSVEYEQKEIHILINEKKYEGFFDKLRGVKLKYR